jgi:hypothetical protein
MNNTFNINRFGLLVKRQWLDFGKIYLISLIVIAGILTGFYIFNIPTALRNNRINDDGYFNMGFRIPLFLIMGFIFISVVSSSYFASFGQKSKAILDLMTPASVFEKFMCGLFYSAIVSILSYLLIFYLTDLAFTNYVNSTLSTFKDVKLENQTLKGAQTFIDSALPNMDVTRAFFAIPFLIASIFFLGSIYFERFHYIKTAVSVMVFSGIASYLIFKTADLLTRDMVSVNRSFRSEDKDNILLIALLITMVLTLIFWTITYVRLKEKEV